MDSILPLVRRRYSFAILTLKEKLLKGLLCLKQYGMYPPVLLRLFQGQKELGVRRLQSFPHEFECRNRQGGL